MDEEHGFGRLEAEDARDLAYPMRAAMVPIALPTYKYWVPGPVLNQGRTSQCVAYAWHQWMETSPIRTKNGPEPAWIYREAQLIDEWPGEDPVVKGTSVRAGAKVLAVQGRIAEYVWAQSIEDVKLWLLTNGPVVIGTGWYEGMMRTDPLGYVKPTGNLVGGHCTILNGYTAGGDYRGMNSWGKYWGRNGHFWLHAEDLAMLLADHGEACAAVEKVIATG